MKDAPDPIFVVDVIVETAVSPLPPGVEELLTTAVTATLRHQQEPPPRALSILLADDEQLRLLNRDFRQLDQPTDVLSFPAGGDVPLLPGEPPYLGDIAISLPYAARQAAQAGHDLAGELQLLTIHGVLHLLGYDHETEAEKGEMWAAQTAVLAHLNLSHITPTEG